MFRAAPSSPPVLAAVLAVAVAVGADVLAGGTAQHTATIGLVGVVVMALRLRLGSRHSALFAAVTAMFLAQPVLHAAMKLTPAGHHPHGTAHAAAHATSHLLDEASTPAVQVLGAAVIVAAVACAEQLFATVAVVRPLLRWLCRPDLVPAPPEGPARPAPAPIARIDRWTHIDHAPQRGPPAAPAAV